MYFQRERNSPVATVHRGHDPCPDSARTITWVGRIGNGHIKIDLVVLVGNGNGEHIVLGIQQGPVVAHREVCIARRNEGALCGKIEQREAIAIRIAGDHRPGRKCDRGRIYNYQKRIGGPTAVFTENGNIDALLRARDVLVGARVGYGVVVLLVDRGRIIENL
ncbi:hypothetical protein AEQU1_00003 [Aequorivita sp. CIP111184]|nr:hypothetical protein AEQU1_00003 [Aequorivita sp. CIP111184]